MAMRAAALVMLLTALTPAGAGAERVDVAVAANFAPCLADLADAFGAATDHEVVAAVGSTGRHHAQILAGAPFDVFLAADSARPRALEASGHAVPGSRFCYAEGALVLWWPAPPHPAPADLRAALAHPDLQYLAVANPRLAPYGEAARQTLVALGMWDGREQARVIGQNIAQAWQFVASGNAQAGLLARSQVTDAAGGLILPVPTDVHESVAQDAVLLTRAAGSVAARAFLDYLRSPEAGRIIAARGYGLPADGAP